MVKIKGTIYVGGNNDDLLEKAIKYVRKNSLDTFLQEATISYRCTKMCILVNLIDSSLSDGEAEREEQVMFGKFYKLLIFQRNDLSHSLK